MNQLKLIVGIGNGARGDDAAGLEVARRLMTHSLRGWEIRETESEPTKLMEMWDGRESVIAVDAVVTGTAPVGTVHRWDASETSLPTCNHLSSSHALGPSEAIELSRVLN
jgi:hydrogenase maturation protease